MRRYFTSDLHLGSSLINKYAHRPWTSAEESVTALGHNINDKLSKADILIHVGDFMLSGADRHGEVEDHGLKYKLDDYLSMLKPNVILLEGNHDTGHNCESAAKSMTVDLNQNYKHVYVSHYPSYHEFYRGPDCSKWTFGRGIVLCGHVHDSWKVMLDAKKNVLNINVGIDAWDYCPVEDVQITELLDFMQCLLKLSPKRKDNNYWTQDTLERDRLAYKKMLEAQRKERKAERYARKGLTPEECQRRKEAAMKAKGLLN